MEIGVGRRDAQLNHVEEKKFIFQQLAYLEQEGCDKIQGYYISRPIPFSELIDGYDAMLSKVYTLM